MINICQKRLIYAAFENKRKPFKPCALFNKTFFIMQCFKLWSMAISGKAKSRCRLGMLKVNNLRCSYLNVMKLGNYGLIRECLNNIAKTF